MEDNSNEEIDDEVNLNVDKNSAASLISKKWMETTTDTDQKFVKYMSK